MNKDKEKINAISNGVKIPKIILEKKVFAVIVANKAVNFRTKLYARLNKIYVPQVKEETLKCRFLYPEKNIPKTNREHVVMPMEEMLMWTLQEQIDYYKKQLAEYEKIVFECEELLNQYKNE
jgi:hypothetical protein